MGQPRTERTRNLEPCKKQFYQLYFIDNYTLVQVTEIFTWLFSMLFKIRNVHLQATEQDWRGRLRQWNKEWQRQKNQSVGLLPAPSIPGELWLRKGHRGLIVLDKSLLSVWEEASARPKFVAAVEYLDDSEQPCLMLSGSEMTNNDEDPSDEISKSTLSEKLVPDSLETILPSLPDLRREGAIPPTPTNPLLAMSSFATMPPVLPACTNPTYSHFLDDATLSQSDTPDYSSQYSEPIAGTIDPKKLMIERREAPDGLGADCVSPRSGSFTASFPERSESPRCQGSFSDKTCNYTNYKLIDRPTTLDGPVVQPSVDMESPVLIGRKFSVSDTLPTSSYPSASSQLCEDTLEQSSGQDHLLGTFATYSLPLEEQGWHDSSIPAWQGSRIQRYGGEQRGLS